MKKILGTLIIINILILSSCKKKDVIQKAPQTEKSVFAPNFYYGLVTSNGYEVSLVANDSDGTGAGIIYDVNYDIISGTLSIPLGTTFKLGSATVNSTDLNNFKTAAANYISASSTNTLTNKSGNISQWTNNAGYLTSITSGQITTALGYTPYNFTGSTSQYTKGDGTYGTFATVATSGSYNDLTNKPSIPSAPTFNNGVSRSISNSAGSTNQFTISTTQNARVTYTITMNWSVTALLSTSGTMYLEYSTNGGTTWNIAASPGKSVNLGLVQTGTDDLSVSGDIPANALVRLRPSNTNSSFTYVRGQEVLY